MEVSVTIMIEILTAMLHPFQLLLNLLCLDNLPLSLPEVQVRLLLELVAIDHLPALYDRKPRPVHVRHGVVAGEYRRRRLRLICLVHVIHRLIIHCK